MIFIFFTTAHVYPNGSIRNENVVPPSIMFFLMKTLEQNKYINIASYTISSAMYLIPECTHNVKLCFYTSFGTLELKLIVWFFVYVAHVFHFL